MATTAAPAAPAAALEYSPLRLPLHALRLLVYGGLLLTAFVGGPLVKLMAGAGLVVALLADVDGFVRHAARMFGLVVAIFVGRWLTPLVAAVLPGSFNELSLLGVSAAMLIAIAGCWIVLMVLTAGVNRWVTHQVELRVLNHAGGLVVGAGEGVMLVALLYWSLAAFDAPLALIQQRLDDQGRSKASPVYYLRYGLAKLQADPAARWLDQRNPVAAVPIVATAREVSLVMADEEAVAALWGSNDLQQLLRKREISTVLHQLYDDPQLKAAIDQHDAETLLMSGKVTDLVNDPELLRLAEAHLPELRQALRNTGNDRLIASAKQLDKAELRRLQRSAKTLLNEVKRSGKLNAELKQLARQFD